MFMVISYSYCGSKQMCMVIIADVSCTLLTWEGTFDEVFKKLQVTILQLSLDVYFRQQGVATAKLALQVLGTPEALELTVDHHCQPGTQSLTLLHTGVGTYQRDMYQLNKSSPFYASRC